MRKYLWLNAVTVIFDAQLGSGATGKSDCPNLSSGCAVLQSILEKVGAKQV